MLVTFIILNMLYNIFFFGIALSEMMGWTNFRAGLPWWLKWIWVMALGAGNLIFHVIELKILI